MVILFKMENLQVGPMVGYKILVSNKLSGDTQSARQSREPYYEWQRERNEKKSNSDLE